MIIYDLMNRNNGALVRCNAVTRNETGEFFVDKGAPAYEDDDPNLPDDAVVAVRFASRYEICLNHERCPPAESWPMLQGPKTDWIGANVVGPNSDWAQAILRNRTSGGQSFSVP
jgi:hypothetical protein